MGEGVLEIELNFIMFYISLNSVRFSIKNDLVLREFFKKVSAYQAWEGGGRHISRKTTGKYYLE